MNTIMVNLAERSYPIYIGMRNLGEIGQAITKHAKCRKIIIVTQESVRQYAEKVRQSCKEKGLDVHVEYVQNGETAKSMAIVTQLLDACCQKALSRQDGIIAVGGGVVGDLAGFVAAIYLRGISFFQVPTTLLAQVDSSVGGKTGVNHPSGKNLIGAFYQPNCVCIDTETLSTLPAREIRCGLAEVVKYGVICDPELFGYLETHADTLNASHWPHLVERSCINKATVVSQDERESGLRAILNFGHTIGHAIEAAFGYTTYLHGEAVALGMIAASRIAVNRGLFAESEHNRLIQLLNRLKFDSHIQPIEVERITKKLILDKKVQDNKIRFVLPTQIGQVTIVNNVPMTLITHVVKEMIS